MTESRPTYDATHLMRPRDPRVARVAAFLGLSWERCHQLPYDVLCAVDAAIDRMDQDRAIDEEPNRD